MENALSQIPTKFWVIIGTIIVANIGTIVTIVYAMGKFIWWMSKLDSRVDTQEKKTADDGPIMKDVNAAHANIREFQKEFREEIQTLRNLGG